MPYRVAAVALVLLAACAQGSSGGDDDVDAHTDAKQDLVDAPGPDASGTDARTDAQGPIDASVDAPSGVGPDTCAQAEDITAGAMMQNGITVTGNTTGYADDVRPASTGCTGFLPDGPDAIYSVTVNAADANAAFIQTALEGLASIGAGKVTVATTATPGVFSVTFTAGISTAITVDAANFTIRSAGTVSFGDQEIGPMGSAITLPRAK